MTTLTFFSTTGCRLCDEVEPELRRLAARLGHHVVYRDVAEDEGLSREYGGRIPVVRREDSGSDLGAPFDTAALYRFLL